MVFRAKVDSYFVKFISIAVLILVVVFIAPLFLDSGVKLIDIIIMVALLILTVAFILYSVFGIVYIFKDNFLLVKGGFFRSKIPYEEITKVTLTREIFFGYRLLSSRDAVEIFYMAAIIGSVKISPRERELFVAELSKRCPHLQIDL